MYLQLIYLKALNHFGLTLFENTFFLPFNSFESIDYFVYLFIVNLFICFDFVFRQKIRKEQTQQQKKESQKRNTTMPLKRKWKANQQKQQVDKINE
jgi:hypothetical protein